MTVESSVIFMFTQTISFLLGRSAERVRKCSASFMSILMFSSSHLLLHLPVKYVLELHSVSCSWFYMTVWLFFLLFSFFYTHIYRQTSSSYHFSFWRRWWWWRKREKTVHRVESTSPGRLVVSVSFLLNFLFFSFIFSEFSFAYKSVSFPPTKSHCDVGLHVYGPSDDNLCCSSSKKKKNQPVSQFQQPKRRRTFFWFFSIMFYFWNML